MRCAMIQFLDQIWLVLILHVIFSYTAPRLEQISETETFVYAPNLINALQGAVDLIYQ